jgi:FkbM family methyltransferase
MTTKLKAIQSKLDCGVPVNAIVDVGVQEKTFELIKIFPSATHHLFEINPKFTPSIISNYRSIDHRLYNIGLYDTNKICYLTSIALKSDGVITHSRISDTKEDVDHLRIVSSEPVKIARFDSLSEISIPDDYLLKIDIDGSDINVLRGFGSEITNASVIIIESHARNLSDTISNCQSTGFRLTDICDVVYYGESIWQCDLVFVRENLVNSKLSPPINPFQKNLWKPI